MPDYSFTSLSPRDFELLCRDLLQAEWRTTLEAFASGPDGGIDLRGRVPASPSSAPMSVPALPYSASARTLIVQCKHYAGSGYPALLRDLKREVPKVRALAPARYVVATSVALTPPNKDEILALFAPYAQSVDEDVLGRDDLNNRLGRHPGVESAHFKLWLTSERTLARIAAAGVVGESDAALMRIRRRLERFVPNGSYPEATRLLAKHHAVVVSGVPGIGKTTLAELIVIEYVDRHGYELVRISQDVTEVSTAKRTGGKQLFFFDDFLGATADVAHDVNADRRLAELLEDVAASEHWRLVLTTREYVLQAARRRSEVLSRAPLEKCTVDLAQYTPGMRAEILFNHIYFSDLSRDYARALLKGRAYRLIAGHPNYNPRVIEHMTTPRNVVGVPPDHYVAAFRRALDDPSAVWRSAFAEQLSEAARHLVLVLATLPAPAELGATERAFDAFYAARRQRYGFSSRSDDLRRAIHDLDGSFVRTDRVGSVNTLALRDPSVRDFVEAYLAASVTDVEDLLDAAIYLEQIEALWRGRRGEPFEGILGRTARLAVRLDDLLEVVGQQTTIIEYSDGTRQVRPAPVNPIHRLIFIGRVARRLDGTTIAPVLRRSFLAVRARLADGRLPLSDLEAVLRADADGLFLPATDEGVGDSLLALAGRRLSALSEFLYDLEEFSEVTSLASAFPGLLSDDDRETLRLRLRDRADEIAEQAIQSYDVAEQVDELRDEARKLARVASTLGVEADQAVKRMDEAVRALEEKGRDDEDDETSIAESAARRVGQSDAIDEHFERWRPELESEGQ